MEIKSNSLKRKVARYFEIDLVLLKKIFKVQFHTYK